MTSPLVTVVVSTYNRPKILKSALESVIYQVFDSWQVLVIGDNCSIETGQMIEDLNHPKIKYHNNTLRYGEQSGSNNIGMALAKTKYIALLNHDDIWTPDHLERAITYLESNQDEFYIANSMFSKRVDKNGFPKFNPPFDQRHLKTAFSSSHLYVEPSSSWVFNKNVIEKVGLWKHGSEISRTPIVNYILRCWRERVNIHFAQQVTCIACAFHHVAISKHAYAYNGQELEKLVAYFKAKKDSDQVYIPSKYLDLHTNNKHKIRRSNKLNQWAVNILANDIPALLYYNTGIDLFEKLTRKRKGFKLSKNRTGETKQITLPKFSEALQLAKKKLE
ncbi:MAG: glycosyltransferase family 2 protein [Nonlabens sp.]